MSDATKAVFLSYASQDAAAAKRIADALRAAGVEVWFDAEGGLEHGDEWDAKIRRQIKECVLFIAVISANTQAREEGYFRIEWELAAQRTLGIASGVAFILPVIIDDTRQPAALVPDRFRSVQWTKLPGGTIPPDILQRFLKLWSHRTGALKQATRDHPDVEARSTKVLPDPKRPAVWLLPLGIAVLAVAGLLLWRASVKPVAAPAVAPLSVARQLATQARTLLAAGRVVSRETLTAADDLAEQALKLDPTDAEVLATSAQVDAFMVYRGFDISEGRRQSAAKRAQRALALAPGSFEARHARAVVAGFLSGSPDMLAESEHIYRELWQERPADDVLGQELGRVLQDENHFADAAAVFLRARQPLDAGWAYFFGGQFQEANKVADRLLAEKRDALTFVLKANVALFGFGDIAAAQSAVGQLTPTELLNDDAAGIALRLALVQRDAPRILQLLGAFANPFVSIGGVNYPRQYWTGHAQLMLSHPDAARSEWHGALQAVEERLKSNSADAESLGWVAVLQALLGEKEAAGQALRLYLNYSPVPAGRWDWWEGLTILHLGGRNDEVLDRLAGELRRPHGHRMLYLFARSCPEFDPLRSDPRLEALLRETLPAGMKPFPATTDQPAGGKVDEKSVAVLAFANLSDDKANEYFSDGISEELLSVLAKIPGLKVTARTSAFYFKGKNLPVAEVARQLGVAYVLEGSVRKAGAKVRIAAQLIKAADGFEVWSDHFDRELTDVFAVQDEIAGVIARNFQLKLGQGPPADRSVNPEAHQLYLQGKYFLNQFSIESATRAEGLLQRSIKLDPSFAPAWVDLASTGIMRGAYGSSRQDTEEGYGSARRAAEHALALDPDLAGAYVALANLQGNHDFNWKAAAESLRRAQALEPANADVIDGQAYLAYTLGQLDRALVLDAQAVALDPVNTSVRSDYGFILVAARRFPEAEAEFRRVIELNPAALWGHAGLSFNFAVQHRYDEAAAEAAKESNEWSRLFMLAVAQWGQKKASLSDENLARLIKSYGDVAAYQVAEVYAFRHENDHAFEWLERAYRQRDPGLSKLKPDPLLGELQKDPRWEPLLSKVGLAHDQVN